MNDARDARPRPFASIVWPSGDEQGRECAPDVLADLALDGVIDRIARPTIAPGVAELFRRLPRDVATVAYRQGVLADLDRGPAREAIEAFADAMREVRDELASRHALPFRHAQNARLASAARRYGAAIERLRDDLDAASPDSEGLRSLLAYVTEYTGSDDFVRFRDAAAEVIEAIAAVRYGLRIDGPTLTVFAALEGPTLAEAIGETFARFNDGVEPSPFVAGEPSDGATRLDQEIIERVERVHPGPFAALDDFAVEFAHFIPDVVARFDREARFYTEYLAFIRPLRAAGLAFCAPSVADGGDLRLRASFDLAVADRLVDEGRPVVPNDVDLAGKERVAVVTGPNQGGKTTFARMIGQAHVLGALGLHVPGTSAEIALPDRVLTHFEREESVSDLRGKLEDDLRRARAMLDECGPASLVIFNEVLTSTTLDDAREMGERILRRVIAAGPRCVFVTFVDELSTLDPAIVSLVCGVEKDDPTRRTFRIERRPAEGLAYAAALAGRYGLTYDAVRGKVGP